MFGGCGQIVGFWSEVDLTFVSRLGAAQRPCGQGGSVTLAHAVLGARCWLRPRPVGPVGRFFGMSTMFLPFDSFSPHEEEAWPVMR